MLPEYSWEIRNARLPNGELACLQIWSGMITGIGPSQGLERFLDAAGLSIVPGLINTHVHFRTPGETHKADWQTECAAALAGGVTTVGDMPNNNPPTDTQERLVRKITQIGRPPVNARFWLAGMPGNASEILGVGRDHLVLGAKTYFERSTGGLVVREKKDRRNIAETVAETRKVNAIHAGSEEINARALASITRRLRAADHCQIRSAESEIAGVEQALTILEETRVKMLFCHLSTPQAVRLVLKAKDRGLPAFIEVCPHHLFLTAPLLERADGTFFQMNPPLRSPEEASALLAHVCNGDVDMINSDHAPHTVQEKQRPYPDSPSGVPGVQELFSLLYALVASEKISLQRFIDLTSANAAELFGLNKGRLSVGADADLVLFDRSAKVAWQHERLLTKCGWSAFALAGLESLGVPRLVIVRGKIRFERGGHPVVTKRL